jgi:uracil-DNA glycosylase family 4
MDKVKELQKIKEDMEADKNLPLVSKPEDVIPGDGNPDAEIFFIGEAGGYNESIQRKPFVGQAGQLLNKFLVLAGIKREDVYITNMVKTRPPNNRDPLPEDLKAYEVYLDRELEIIQPKVIITLGRFSMAKFLPNVFISSVHGKKYNIFWKGRNIVVIPMYHPAASLRNGNVLEQEKTDFVNLKTILAEIFKPKDDIVKVEQPSLI